MNALFQQLLAVFVAFVLHPLLGPGRPGCSPRNRPPASIDPLSLLLGLGRHATLLVAH